MEIRVVQPGRPAPEEDDEPTFPPFEGPAFLSYGFRPFFLCAALFASLAVPLWVTLYADASSPGFLFPPRDWHVHEMLFGFLPAVITGFLLTAVPNWTGRPPLRGLPLLSFLLLWLAGRLLVALAWPTPLVVALVDGTYLVVLAAYLWRELVVGGSLGQAPIAMLISLYAATNVLYHALALGARATDLAERMVLSLIMLLLTVIGGRLTPNFTREYLLQARVRALPPGFSRVDGLAIGLVVLAAAIWIAEPEGRTAGWALATAGAANLIRLGRWQGWRVWREPLVLVLHAGYGWLALSCLALGGALLGVGLAPAEAVHALTTGAVGTMTLAVMTRASLGHTGRSKQAGPLTVSIYVLVSMGALFRVFVPSAAVPTTLTHVVLGFAAFGWSGAYLLFVLGYGPFLLRPSLDE